MNNDGKRYRLIEGVLLPAAVPVLVLAQKANWIRPLAIGFIAYVGMMRIFEAVIAYREKRQQQ